MTDGDDTEMFDHDDEDKDLESQVTKGLPKPNNTGKGEPRNGREDTPAPEEQQRDSSEKPRTPDPVEGGSGNPFDTPSSTTSEKSESTETTAPIIPSIHESALPTKLVNTPQKI